MRVTDTPRFHAHPSLAIDSRDRVWIAYDFAASATEAGDDVAAIVLEDAAHFEPVVPGTDAWSEVRAVVLDLLGWRDR